MNQSWGIFLKIANIFSLVVLVVLVVLVASIAIGMVGYWVLDIGYQVLGIQFIDCSTFNQKTIKH